MTIEEKLRAKINSEFGSLRAFTIQKGLNYANMDSILRRGIKNATWTSVKKMCAALSISADELFYDRIVPVDPASEPKSKKQDFQTVVNVIRQNLQDYDDLTVDGIPIDDTEKLILLDLIDCGIRIIRMKRQATS